MQPQQLTHLVLPAAMPGLVAKQVHLCHLVPSPPPFVPAKDSSTAPLSGGALQSALPSSPQPCTSTASCHSSGNSSLGPKFRAGLLAVQDRPALEALAEKAGMTLHAMVHDFGHHAIAKHIYEGAKPLACPVHFRSMSAGTPGHTSILLNGKSLVYV